MSEWPRSADDPQDDAIFAARKEPAKRALPEVLPALRNWQVLEGEVTAGERRQPTPQPDQPVEQIEIEGVATVVATVDATAALSPASQPSTTTGPLPIADQHDPVLIATLTERHLAVQPGEMATYQLSLLNNGPHAAHFTVTAEGWIDDQWLAAPAPSVTLAPGERQVVAISLQPPRTTRTHVGQRAVAFCIRADAYPERCTRLGATLTITPYTDLRLGRVQPLTATLSWWQPRVTLTLPITNRSNHPLAIRLAAHDREQRCRFTVTLPGSTASAPNMGKLAPGQRLLATVQVRLQHPPFWQSRPRELPIQLLLKEVDAATPATSATVALTVTPLMGLWQLTSLVGMGALLLAAVGVAGLSAVLFLAINFVQPALSPPPAQAAPAPIVIYIQSPLPERQAPSKVTAPPSTPTVSPVAIQSSLIPMGQDERDPTAPLVSAAEVSAPGAPVITGPSAAPPAAAHATTMTYGVMFQEIAMRYDLNWRLLAAQAYVESGFDSLALGQHGDLGLMQIQPGTWREWAPKVDAKDPFDSYSNVMVSAAYSDYLRATLSKRGHSQPQWVLLAYNWGLDKVLQHLESGKEWEDLAPQRQQYATEVMRLAETIQTN